MTNGSVEAETILRMTLQGSEFFLRLTGNATLRMVAFLKAMKDNHTSPGAIRLKEMLKSGKPSTVISVPEDKLQEFAAEAKTYGIQYVMAKRIDENGRGMWDVLVYAEDAARVQRVADNIGMTTLDGMIETNVSEEEKQGAVELTEEQRFIQDLTSRNPEREKSPELQEELTEGYQYDSSSLNISDEIPAEKTSVNGRASIVEQLKDSNDDMVKTMDMFALARELRKSMLGDDAPEQVKEMDTGWRPDKEEYDEKTGERLYRGKRAEDMTDTDKLQYMVDNEMNINGSLSEKTIKSMYEAGYQVDRKGMVKPLDVTLNSKERKLIADMMAETVRDRERDEAAAGVKGAVSKAAEAVTELKK